MRKKVVGLVLIFGFGLVQVNAQNLVSKLKEKLSLGLKVEGNYSNFILSDMDNVQSTMGFGASAGTVIKFDITKYFAIQEDIMFTYYSSEFKQNGIKDTYQYFGTEVPIYLMGQWSTATGGRFYGGVGPYFGMGFSSKLKDSDTNFYKKMDGNAFMKRFSTGLAAQIGYEFNFGLQINGSYKIGNNVLDAESNNSKMNPQSISLGLGYRF